MSDLQTEEITDTSPKTEEGTEFCHVLVSDTHYYCGKEMDTAGVTCPPYNGEAVCPGCGLATCPSCAVMVNLEERLEEA